MWFLGRLKGVDATGAHTLAYNNYLVYSSAKNPHKLRGGRFSALDLVQKIQGDEFLHLVECNKSTVRRFSAFYFLQKIDRSRKTRHNVN